MASFAAAETKLVDQAFEHFYNLDYPEAIGAFERAITSDPGSPVLHNHLAQALTFQEMYRNGSLESEMVSGNDSFLRQPKLNASPETERRILREIATAIRLADGMLKRNPNDVTALYSLGISYGLRCNYNWLVRKAWHDSLSDATAARRYHNRITEIDPGNVDARLVQGLHDYIVGSLPWTLRTLGFLVGIRGDREKGIRTIQEVSRHGRENRIDAAVFLCALYRRERTPRLAVPLLQELIQRFPRNYLLRMELSQMYSLAGDGKKSLEAVAEVTRLKQAHAPGYDRVPWEKIYYQEGTVEFWYNDLDNALNHLAKVAAARSELDLNTGAYTYLRLGQIYDLRHQRAQAIDAYKSSIAFAPDAAAAAESRKYISRPYTRS
jgi:tetratricopeptide (TPR) repeat protein